MEDSVAELMFSSDIRLSKMGDVILAAHARRGLIN